MVTKIKVALDSRLSDDTLIIARTDARKAIGRDEAMRRSEMYIKAGADILFYEAPADIDEMREIGQRFGGDIPLLSNMVNGGVTPVMKPEELKALGYRIAIFPSSGFLAACNALNSVYGALKEQGDAEKGGMDLYSFADFNELMGFNEITEFEERYS
jgi:2,3-dimethylmalate lyase